MQQQILERLKAVTRDGKVACKAALDIANTLDCSPAKVGEVANQEGIKVGSCQLGCFK